MILLGVIGILSLLLIVLSYCYQKLKLHNLISQERIKNQEELKEILQLVSSEALEKSHDSLYEMTQRELDKKQQSFHELLHQLNLKLHLLENERKIDHGALQQQLKSLIASESQLQRETSKLSQTLRSPISRGRWGEIQLKRIVELAGMLQHCDFFEQSCLEGERRRPDLIVKLPGSRSIIIDAKVPLEAYLESLETSDENIILEKLQQHARHVKEHISQLSKKKYWDSSSTIPEFVILFLPSEAIFSIALEKDPSLIEYGAQGGVILATPTTLIALLKSIAYGWKQENLSRYTQEMSLLAKELYKKIADFSSQWEEVGKGLKKSVEQYNRATRSLEKEIFSLSKQLGELGANSPSHPIKEVDNISH